jgi:hypothetical protein
MIVAGVVGTRQSAEADADELQQQQHQHQQLLLLQEAAPAGDVKQH